MNWTYKCISCKKQQEDVESDYAKHLDNKKKLDSGYDKNNKIAWIVCGDCIEKGKRAGHYFPSCEKQLKKQPRAHLIIYGPKGKQTIDFVYPYTIPKTKTKGLYVEVAKALSKFRKR
jgi:hypothetical protein